MELSDGIGIAKAVICREVISELELHKWNIAKGSVLVIRGLIFRQSCDDGQTAFILNECPRLVLNEVTGIVGKPIPLLKAVA